MHIGFDISQTGSGKAGCGFFAHAMIKAMIEAAPGHRYALYPGFGDFYFDPLMPMTNPYAGPDVHYGPRHLSRETARTFWSAPDLERALGQPDIVQANNFWCPAPMPRSRIVYTFYDMGFAIEPRWTTEANRLGCFDGVFRSALAADWVVAISKSSRDDYLRTFPHFPASRVAVIHPCSRFTDPQARGTRPKALAEVRAEGFLLNVGTVEPRKNQHRLADAYARYVARTADPMPLVLAGGRGWLMDGFEAHLEDLGIADRVILTGYVTDDELVWLYRNCYANLYPSLFEGFGLPVLEGMQMGAPTVASSSSSIPEVAGDAAILLDPTDVEGWAAALGRLHAEPGYRAGLREAARRQAARFDWRDSAGALLSLYDEVLASPKLAVPSAARAPAVTVPA
jgi:glycosyltransferase involved in cell wall biosynthesis